MTRVTIHKTKTIEEPEVIDVTFPVYLKYEGDTGDWRDYRDIRQVQEDGKYTEICVHEGRGSREFSISNSRMYLKDMGIYFKNEFEYSWTSDPAEFQLLMSEILNAVRQCGLEEGKSLPSP